MFSRLATQQLFEKAERDIAKVDEYINKFGTIFKEFPPYVNEITKIYPFNHQSVSEVDLAFETDIQALDAQILAVENEYSSADDDMKKTLRQKRHDLQQQKELRKWEAYSEYLSTQHPQLGPIFGQLVHSKFDFSVLSPADQQVLVTVLVEHKLQEVIRTKINDLLDVDEEDLSTFFHDLFDLTKMNITIPTRRGNIPISFVKKEFMATSLKELPPSVE